MPFNGPAIPFGAMVEYHPISATVVTASVRLKGLARYISRPCVVRGEIWKGDIVVADIEEMEEMDASELHARRLNAKEVLTPLRCGNFIFPFEDRTV